MGRTLRDVPALVARRAEFTISNVFSQNYGDGSAYALGGGWNSYATPLAGTRYAVFSYNTPIGWIDRYGHAIIPRQYHSSSTSRHQNLLHGSLVDDDPVNTSPEALRALADFKAKEDLWFASEAERKREERNSRQRERRARERSAREAQRQRDIETAQALESIAQGAKPGFILMGVEGEREAVQSLSKILAPDAYVRDARPRRVTTRT